MACVAIEGASETALRGEPSLLDGTEVGKERSLGKYDRVNNPEGAPKRAPWLSCCEPLL